MKPAWRDRPEGGNRFALRLIAAFALRFGRRPARLALYPITAYFVLRRGAERRASREYLEQLRGRAVSAWEIFRHVHCFACTILDRVFLLCGSREEALQADWPEPQPYIVREDAATDVVV